MPSLARLLCKLLSLPEELALGVVLVGCCPGGTASNVICYLAKGDVALSVAMTGVSTLLAPIVTPALVWLLAGESVEVDVAGMFLSIVQVVIVPIVLGVAANHYFQRTTRRIVPLLPMISTLSIAFIIGIIVAHNAASILACSLIVAVAVILHNVLGLALGIWSLLSCRKRAVQTIGHCHRGGHAEFRSGHFTGRHSFCPVSHGGRTRSHVLGMAQLFGQHCGTDFQKTGR